jgi:hypothetical protein
MEGINMRWKLLAWADAEFFRQRATVQTNGFSLSYTY